MRTYRCETIFDVGDMLQSVLAVVAEGLNDLLQVGLKTAELKHAVHQSETAGEEMGSDLHYVYVAKHLGRGGTVLGSVPHLLLLLRFRIHFHHAGCLLRRLEHSLTRN